MALACNPDTSTHTWQETKEVRNNDSGKAAVNFGNCFTVQKEKALMLRGKSKFVIGQDFAGYKITFSIFVLVVLLCFI